MKQLFRFYVQHRYYRVIIERLFFEVDISVIIRHFPLGTRRKLNEHEIFRRCLGPSVYVLCPEGDTSSVIGQKGESQNGCFKKTKHDKFSEKRTFLTP